MKRAICSAIIVSSAALLGFNTQVCAHSADEPVNSPHAKVDTGPQETDNRTNNSSSTDDEQVTSGSTDDASVTLQSVSVTAQLRKQQVQDVPISMTVVSGPQFQRAQVRQIDGIEYLTPNILIAPNTGLASGAKFFIRGIGSGESMFTNDPPVALYIDGVYIPRSNGAMLDLYNVRRIEVLRGPQGTLFGRNATAGAIRYITKKPDGRKRIKLSLNTGNFGRVDAEIGASGKVGRVSFDAAFLSHSRDGYMYDVSHDRWVNSDDVKGARVTLGTYWGEASYATLVLDKVRDRSSATFATPIVPVPDGRRRVPKLANYYQTKTDILGFNALDQWGATLINETTFDDLAWKSTLHYRALHSEYYIDADGTDVPIYSLYQDQEQSQYGYEGHFTSYTDGPVSWVAGVFYFHEHNEAPIRTDIFGPGATNHVSLDTDAYAVYGQATWHFADAWRLIGGARYSYETKDFLVRQTAVDGAVNFQKRLSGTWSHPDWKLVLQHDFNDHMMGYLSFTTGFKSGTFNGRGTSEQSIAPVGQATLDAYEIGYKSNLFGNRLRFNIDYYRLNYQGMQMSAQNDQGIFTLTNATGALIQGVEMQFDAQITSKLQISGGLGTVNAKYQNYSQQNAAYFSTHEMKHSPDMQSTLGINFIQPVGTSQIVFSVQARYTDQYYQNRDNTKAVMTDANTQVKARIAYVSDQWTVALWGANLTDETISTGGFYVPALGIADMYVNPPRMYGVELKYDFGY